MNITAGMTLAKATTSSLLIQVNSWVQSFTWNTTWPDPECMAWLQIQGWIKPRWEYCYSSVYKVGNHRLWTLNLKGVGLNVHLFLHEKLPYRGPVCSVQETHLILSKALQIAPLSLRLLAVITWYKSLLQLPEDKESPRIARSRKGRQ